MKLQPASVNLLLVFPHKSFNHSQRVKAANKTEAKKTPGTLAVEKHRPLMNKLTAAQRQRLRQRAGALITP
jgi:putative NADPH-quinone reductase